MATWCPQGAFTRCGGSCLYSVVRGHVCSCDRCSLDLDPQPRYQMELLLDDGFVALAVSACSFVAIHQRPRSARPGGQLLLGNVLTVHLGVQVMAAAARRRHQPLLITRRTEHLRPLIGVETVAGLPCDKASAVMTRFRCAIPLLHQSFWHRHGTVLSWGLHARARGNTEAYPLSNRTLLLAARRSHLSRHRRWSAP